MFRTKRVYEPVEPTDGARILVDRLWPRGLAKETAGLTDWKREIAPSDELRRWFGHDPDRWALFCERYERELEKSGELLDELRELERSRGTVTLCFAAKDELRNNAVVLKRVLEGS